MPQALLGIAIGAQTNVPESPSEAMQRATANAQRAKPWQEYAQNYQRLVESGTVKVDRSPALDKITSSHEAMAAMKASALRLQALTSGQEGGYAGNDKAGRIRAQVNWMLSLGSRFKELMGRDVTMEELARVK